MENKGKIIDTVSCLSYALRDFDSVHPPKRFKFDRNGIIKLALQYGKRLKINTSDIEKVLDTPLSELLFKEVV